MMNLFPQVNMLACQAFVKVLVNLQHNEIKCNIAW